MTATLESAGYPAATTWGRPDGMQLRNNHESIPLGVVPVAPNRVIISISHCEPPNKGSMTRQNGINSRLAMQNAVYMGLIQGNTVKRQDQELTCSLGPVTWRALCMMSNTEGDASAQKLHINKSPGASGICRSAPVQPLSELRDLARAIVKRLVDDTEVTLKGSTSTQLSND